MNLVVVDALELGEPGRLIPAGQAIFEPRIRETVGSTGETTRGQRSRWCFEGYCKPARRQQSRERCLRWFRLGVCLGYANRGANQQDDEQNTAERPVHTPPIVNRFAPYTRLISGNGGGCEGVRWA